MNNGSPFLYLCEISPNVKMKGPVAAAPGGGGGCMTGKTFPFFSTIMP